jgi:hypothetical protein
MADESQKYFYVRLSKESESQWYAVDAGGKCTHLAATEVLGRPSDWTPLDRPVMVEVLYSIRVPVRREPLPRQEGVDFSRPTHEERWYRSINDFIVGPGSRWFWTHVSDLPAPEGMIDHARQETGT